PPLAVADQFGGRAAAMPAASVTHAPLISHTLTTLTVTASVGLPPVYEMSVSGVPLGALVHWTPAEQFIESGKNSSQLADTVFDTPKSSVTCTPRLQSGRKMGGPMTSTGG